MAGGAAQAEAEVVDLTGDTDDDAVVALPPQAKRFRAAGGGAPGGQPEDDDAAPGAAPRDGDADGAESDEDIQLVGVTGEVRDRRQWRAVAGLGGKEPWAPGLCLPLHLTRRRPRSRWRTTRTHATSA